LRSGGLGREVVAGLHVFKQRRVGRCPAEQCPRAVAGDGCVGGEATGKERVADVLGELLADEGGGRDLEDPGDLVGDGLDGDTAFSGAVQRAAGACSA